MRRAPATSGCAVCVATVDFDSASRTPRMPRTSTTLAAAAISRMAPMACSVASSAVHNRGRPDDADASDACGGGCGACSGGVDARGGDMDACESEGDA